MILKLDCTVNPGVVFATHQPRFLSFPCKLPLGGVHQRKNKSGRNDLTIIEGSKEENEKIATKKTIWTRNNVGVQHYQLGGLA